MLQCRTSNPVGKNHAFAFVQQKEAFTKIYNTRHFKMAVILAFWLPFLTLALASNHQEKFFSADSLNAWYKKIEPHAIESADALLAAIPANKKQSDCLILDIGANLCACSKRFLQQTNCEVWAFEAVPQYASFCYERLKRHPRFRVLPLAMCERPATLDFYLDHANRGWNTMETRMTDTKQGRKTSVLCAPLDNVLPRVNAKKLIGAKIDTEGAEYRVLAGMHDTLMLSPVPLKIEVGWGPYAHPKWDREAEQFEWLFTEAGYGRIDYNATSTVDVIFRPL